MSSPRYVTHGPSQKGYGRQTRYCPCVSHDPGGRSPPPARLGDVGGHRLGRQTAGHEAEEPRQPAPSSDEVISIPWGHLPLAGRFSWATTSGRRGRRTFVLEGIARWVVSSDIPYSRAQIADCGLRIDNRGQRGRTVKFDHSAKTIRIVEVAGCPRNCRVSRDDARATPIVDRSSNGTDTNSARTGRRGVRHFRPSVFGGGNCDAEPTIGCCR